MEYQLQIDRKKWNELVNTYKQKEAEEIRVHHGGTYNHQQQHNQKVNIIIKGKENGKQILEVGDSSMATIDRMEQYTKIIEELKGNNR